MVLNPVSRLTPTPQGRQTLQASVVHRSSIDNGQPNNMRPVNNSNLPNITSDAIVPRNATQSPRSPSSADILEVMPLYPRSQNSTTQVTNVYQLRHIKREHNNNHSDLPVDTRHVYSNDLIKDLAMLRNTLRQETALNTMRDIEDETRFLESRYINDKISNNEISTNPLSPTLSTTSEHYAQLSLEQQQLQEQQLHQQQNQAQEQQEQIQQDQQKQQQLKEKQCHQQLPQQEPPMQQLPQLQKETARLYMNIVASDVNVPEVITIDPVPSTPLTLKPIEYCNLTIGNKAEINTYANLSLGELGDSVKHAKHVLGFSSSEHKQAFSEFDTIAPISPVEEIEVNYAVLDIDSNKETMKISRDLIGSENTITKKGGGSQSRGRLLSQISTDKPTPANAAGLTPAAAIGYTTIDFDKTVALTSVAAGEEVGMSVEGCRKTRHNSGNILCGTGSLGHNDKK